MNATAVGASARRSKGRGAAPVRDSRQAIFDAAERLCGEHGLEAVSVRDIAAAADVNLSAINYYYGSRTNLLVQILRTRGGELDAERKRLLAEARDNRTLSPSSILRAVLAPLSQWRQPGSERQAALKFLSRALLTSVPELKLEIDQGVLGFRAYIDLLQQVLPALSREEICWRFHFMMSIEHMNAWDNERLQILSGAQCRADDPSEALERALDFALAGFLAPPWDAARRR